MKKWYCAWCGFEKETEDKVQFCPCFYCKNFLELKEDDGDEKRDN